ncbi:unnamed protein product [Meganyctiphanes norvegica]|uniref:Uncharacterized protein n=1 Tax=Meganyctiphanes norvegica TaxID=48144 RepID=A0AAV2R9M8_MEGNR
MGLCWVETGGLLSRISLLSRGSRFWTRSVPRETGGEKAKRCTALLPGLRAGRSTSLGVRSGRLVVVDVVVVVDGILVVVVVVVVVEGTSAGCVRVGGRAGKRVFDPAPG